MGAAAGATPGALRTKQQFQGEYMDQVTFEPILNRQEVDNDQGGRGEEEGRRT